MVAPSTAAAEGEPEASAPEVDVIDGRPVPRDESWWVDGSRIMRGKTAKRLVGINWFGLETAERALHGLWSGRDQDEILEQVVAFGFNALRVPLSPDAIRPGHKCAPWAVVEGKDGDPIDTGREQLERLLEATQRMGLYVLLDFHSCEAGPTSTHVGRPDSCAGYEIKDWHADLAALAKLSHGFPHVVGIDLFNEPYGASWTEWKGLAESAAKVVLSANPKILVFVQGVGGQWRPGQVHGTFWGEDLTGMEREPLDIPRARLVLSPHVYGPGVRRQPYFEASDFPNNLPAIWDAHFGSLRERYPVVVGEFGGFNDDDRVPGEEAWNRAFVAYLAGWPAPSFFYWALNPNSGDTGGLLTEDWKGVDRKRLELLRPLLKLKRDR